jgi:hypothetical protein
MIFHIHHITSNIDDGVRSRKAGVNNSIGSYGYHCKCGHIYVGGGWIPKEAKKNVLEGVVRQYDGINMRM